MTAEPAAVTNGPVALTDTQLEAVADVLADVDERLAREAALALQDTA